MDNPVDGTVVQTLSPSFVAAIAVRPSAKFCDECGTPVAGAAPTQAVPRPADRSPRTYTPKHLAEKILQSKSALEGERKQVTVLFADVKGSMELAESLDPEEWHRILERFFEILTEGVHRFEGTVNQYTGDGIMALFGAPISHEDHAQRACYAALHLRDALRAYADELRRTQGVNLRETRGIQARREIEAALVEAAAWIERSGAKSYEPFLHLERAELARLTGDEASRERALSEAHRLFVEIGATARADQISLEIAR